MKKIVWFHLVPLSLACLTLFFLYEPLLGLYRANSHTLIPEYSSTELTGETRFLTNYNQSYTNELLVARSLVRPKQLTLFGSSELYSGVGESLSSNFLPDSLGAPILAIGHGFHELFAIYCELLYFSPYLSHSKINIVLSPGWFQDGKGTLPQSFIEFVPPHFITRIVHDTTISEDHKQYLAHTVAQNYEGELAGNRLEYKYLSALAHNIPKTETLKNALIQKHTLKVSNDQPPVELKSPKWAQWLRQAETNSLKTLNQYFIDSTYFRKYTSDKSGNIWKMKVNPVPSQNNQEFEDLKMIVKLLKEHNCEVSFVMQPLNPYYYEHIDNFGPIMDSISQLMKKEGLEENYLNLFVTDPKNYQPGILRDVMHFSDFGWMTVNKFLYERHFAQ
jgi:poly-D-alanine transfer protein DltD